MSTAESPLPEPSFPELEVLLDDAPVLAINKPAGLLTLGAGPGVPTLERQVKQYLKDRFQKPGNVYLGIPHRLDRPVSGVILFARNSKAAARLAEQFRERQVNKTYWAVVDGIPDSPEATLTDWLVKVPDQAKVAVVDASVPGAREARLHYRTLATGSFGALLEIELETGRMHQIRVQLAARGWPVRGDLQYGSLVPFGDAPPADATPEHFRQIALHARSLTFQHPVRYTPVTVVAPLPRSWGELKCRCLK